MPKERICALPEAPELHYISQTTSFLTSTRHPNRSIEGSFVYTRFGMILPLVGVRYTFRTLSSALAPGLCRRIRAQQGLILSSQMVSIASFSF